MALDKRLQNPKRSQFDPTELASRLADLEKRIKELEEAQKISHKFLEMEINFP